MSSSRRIQFSHFNPSDRDELIEIIKLNALTPPNDKALRYDPYVNGDSSFESLRHDLIPFVRQLMNDENLWISRDLWGLRYTDNKDVCPHTHLVAKWNAVLYLRVDPGAGKLYYRDPDLEIAPHTGMLLIASPDWTHGVYKNESTADRYCIPMNIHDKRDIAAAQQNADTTPYQNTYGQYTLDEPI